MPTEANDLREAFLSYRDALADALPDVLEELRSPAPFEIPYARTPGAEQLLALWRLTNGQAQGKDGTLGAAGGLRLLGPVESERERNAWLPLMNQGGGLDAVARPAWDASSAREPNAVRAVYFAAGWLPVLSEPYEANYLAVDLVPLPDGRPGQVILCGRDEDQKCVIAPDLATVFRRLAAECAAGTWTVETQTSRKGNASRRLERDGGRLLSAWRLEPGAY